ncbi:MAG: competence/damage-inducible protein A [Actinomycetota bacterium]|nr:competence/damage-inducible protein A [Actinomycetota bacterium]
MNATCIIVGDEILSGHVQDANGHFIATRLAVTGHRLMRMSVVPDDPEAIAGALRADLSAGAAIVFVCGGLGPTHDDRTMEAVAGALSRSLEPCPPIVERIERIVDRMRTEGFAGDPLGISGLEKMALVPAGSEFVECGVGVIPAVTLVHEGARIVILPGPPRELQAVFIDGVEPQFLAETGAPLARIEVEHLFPESSLAAALTEIERRFPGVSLGSYPLEDRVLIRIAGPEEDAHAAAASVREAIVVLEESEEGRRLLTYFRGSHER